VPRLAASWEHSPDGRVLTFHLRSGVRFHDGAPLTSDDVVFTWERIMDPASRAVGRVDAFLSVEKVEALDPLTVKVTYREPFAPALRGWEIPILPAHLYRGVDFATAPANRSPVGTGPFRFVSWEAGRRIVLEANRDYWAGPPGLEQFVFAIIPSMDTAFEALLAREVDYARVPSTRVASPGAVPAAERGYQEMRYTPQFFYYIAWRGDGSNPFFADPRVRRALGAALDREGYIRTVLKGLGEMVTSPFTALQPATSLAPADSDTQAHAQALPQARANTPPEDPAALLDAAGWKRDPATGMRRRGTTPFRFTLLVFSGGEDHLQFSQVAQENLRRLGVDMRIERLDWQTLWSRLKSGDFQAALSGFVPQADPDSLYGLLHSTQIHGGQNYAAYRDPEVDAWLEAGRRTLDEPARAALYRRVEERIATQQPYAFLFAPVIVAGVSLRYEGAVISPQGIVGHMPGAWALRPARGGS
jgi:peptide/nickel transport system substrate-binding protein